jgi:hypothetical protein
MFRQVCICGGSYVLCDNFQLTKNVNHCAASVVHVVVESLTKVSIEKMILKDLGLIPV